MQVLITHGRLSRTRLLQFQAWQLLLSALLMVALLMAVSGTVYHFVFLKAAREGWPVVSPLVRLLVRNGVTYTVLAAALKRLFLQAAQQELAQRGMTHIGFT